MYDSLLAPAVVVIEVVASLAVLVLVLAVGAILTMYLIDVRQTRHAIRRNYPVIGRLRYYFEDLGQFFRQYFYAMDREEMPFNRSQRSWVYRAAKKVDTTVAFGSTQSMATPGTLVLLPHAFPTLEEDSVPPRAISIGPGCREPYVAPSFFNISAMSFGAISMPAVRALSRGAARAGCWLNTGEGGLSPYHLEGGCDLVFQIGTANYGVRDPEGDLSDARVREIAALPQVKMFEIKISQGAKPGKGGILPAVKVTAEVAAIRGIPEGQSSISPNGHRDIRSVDQLLDKIVHLRALTGKPVGFKLVVGNLGFFDELFTAIDQRGADACAPDFINIDSGDGGTGAAPQSLLDNAGLTIRESLPMVVDKLVEYGLRERIRVIAAGKLINPVDVCWALAVGADFVVSARGFMFALGCIQAMQCHQNTCPTGVTTHDPRLHKGLDPLDKAERVANYLSGMITEVGVIAHSCGVREPRELTREHMHIVVEMGQSVPLSDYYRALAPRQSARVEGAAMDKIESDVPDPAA